MSGDKLAKIYEPLGRPIIRTNVVTSEMIKYGFNCALATRISYWNEIYYICKLLDIDSETVARVAGMDPRIGTYGTVHGKAFGGKCLPKDLRALLQFVTDLGYDPKLLRAVEEINEHIGAEEGVRD
jgi:UDPglucose 6-dehydrogenase